MTTYHSYHTELKCLAREGLLSKEIAVLIPRTNLWRWRNEADDKYKDFDLNLRAAQDYELIRSFSQSKNAKRIYSSFVRLSKFFMMLAHGIPKFHKRVQEMKMELLTVVDRVKSVLGLLNVLRVFNISVFTYRQWSLETLKSCFHSQVNKCNRIYPTQLSSPEVNKLKEMLIDPANQYWPISSIAFESLRNGTLPLSLNTWYKYAKRLGINRPRPTDRGKKSVRGIRASRPNEIWHADITRFITTDQMVHYIYLVVDNFSRKILSWFVADNVSAMIRRQTIDLALKNVKYEDQHIVIITDGGPENSLKDYLETLSVSITHQKALIDIRCSNSMVEGHNKLIKYNYLYKMPINDRSQLIKQLAWVHNNFDNRPHISLHGLTPNEAYQNITLDKETLKNLNRIATLKRKEHNLNNRCVTCLGN